MPSTWDFLSLQNIYIGKLTIDSICLCKINVDISMKKKIVCLFICVTIIEMLVGDWREGERRSGGRREPPSSPGCPTPSSNHRQTSTNKTHRLNNNNKQSPGGESGSPTAKVVRSKWVEEPDYENIRYHFSALKKFPSLLSDI